MKKIAMIIAKSNFRDEELLVPKQIFEENGNRVTVASSRIGVCVGKLGAKVTSDTLYTSLSPKDYDAVVFIGGGGCSEYFDDQQAHNLANDFYKSQKVVAAVCAAPTILARAGLPKNRKATSFESEKENVIKGGATYVDKPVVTDGRLITGNGPGAAEDFAN